MLYMLYDIILLESSMSFSMILWLVTITMSSDVWQCDYDITLTLTLDPNKENKRKNKKTRELNKETSVQALYV